MYKIKNALNWEQNTITNKIFLQKNNNFYAATFFRIIDIDDILKKKFLRFWQSHIKNVMRRGNLNVLSFEYWVTISIYSR